ncbi:hypothetical protein ACOSP7_020751 [Xanthoceras sorbifolium]
MSSGSGKCRKCRKVGHNIRTCNNPAVGAQRPKKKTTTGGTKRRNFDIGSTSTSTGRRKLNLGYTVASGRANVGQSHIQHTSTQFLGSTSRTEAVAEPSS